MFGGDCFGVTFFCMIYRTYKSLSDNIGSLGSVHKAFDIQSIYVHDVAAADVDTEKRKCVTLSTGDFCSGLLCKMKAEGNLLHSLEH